MSELRQLHVRPARPGLIIRYPTNPSLTLPDAGETVPADTFWLRLLRDGDVVEVAAEDAPQQE